MSTPENPFERRSHNKSSRGSRTNSKEQEEQISKYKEQIQEMQAYMEYLESEASDLRRKLNASEPSDDVDVRLYETTRELIKAHRRNRKLANALQETKEKLGEIKEKVEKLSAPPNNYGVFLKDNEDGTVDIDLSGKKWRVNVDPGIDVAKLKKGQEIVVNAAFNVVSVCDYDDLQGEVVKVKDMLDDKRVVVTYRADEERVVELSDRLKGSQFKFGDNVLVNPQNGMILEKLPKAEVEDLMLEEVPDVTYSNIGGLDEQIEEIRDAIELPYLYPEEFKEFGLTAPKGVLLYGPPGCGKTLIAQAVANNLAAEARKRTKNKSAKGYFISVKGPELLNKYVGETERRIREVFQKAKDKAKEEEVPVIIFFDEMDSMFRSRGTGISSDMESTIVPQFLSEIDGVEGLRNVIVIGASNRQDLIDPAVLRPGRLDVKIKIDRPNREASKDIFTKYLTSSLPIAQSEIDKHDHDVEKTIESMIDRAVEEMFEESDENMFIEVTYERGERETLYFKDFVSGAMIENIVSRAKRIALKRLIKSKDAEKGLKYEDLHKSIRQEYSENEDLPNTTNPDDWAKIAGRKGERIVSIKTLFKEEGKKKKDVRVVKGGTYL